MKKQELKKKNNKGFSLVELIVVIAIMAVLVGILAPQFIKYVDQSRRSTDIKNCQEYVSAIQVYAADHACTVGGTITLGTGATASTVTDPSDVKAAIEAAGLELKSLKSNVWGASTIVVTYSADGAPTITINDSSATYNLSGN